MCIKTEFQSSVHAVPFASHKIVVSKNIIDINKYLALYYTLWI